MSMQMLNVVYDATPLDLFAVRDKTPHHVVLRENSRVGSIPLNFNLFADPAAYSILR